MITLMKASAGSGKTWNLAKTYISLLLGACAASGRNGGPDGECSGEARGTKAYRHILAVTFTNKATDEMKSRIIRELALLGGAPQYSSYYPLFAEEFIPSVFPDGEAMSRRCRDILCDILHDYGAFSVSTIDSFFQQILRAFSRELGQYESYRLELDHDMLVEQSVDMMLDALSENDRDLIDWLRDKAMEQLAENGKFDIEKSLYAVAKTLSSRSFREASERAGADPDKMCSRENVSGLRKLCREYADGYRAAVSEAVSALREDFRSVGADFGDTSRQWAVKLEAYILPPDGGASGAKRGGFVLPSESNMNCLSYAGKSLEDWFTKANRPLAGRLGEVPGFETHREALVRLFTEDYRLYKSAGLILSCLFGFGVYRELRESYASLLKENNIMCLEDSGSLLNGIIDGSDAPFIYEKTGTRYDSFLLDEFQDTSTVQWRNFEPLLRNSEASGNQNLIVGDVKQSIYRWRDSDWKLLEYDVPERFPGRIRSISLDTNFRSEARIVEFNNLFFKYLCDHSDEFQKVAETGDAGSSATAGRNAAVFRQIYADVRQKCKRAGAGVRGNVDIAYVPKAGIGQEILAVIGRCLEKGARYGDIAVLVRSNRDGERYAKLLMENGIPVVSDDSLSVASSSVVRRLVALLSRIANPEDTVAGYLATALDVRPCPPVSSLADVAEHYLRELKKADPVAFDEQSPYIQAFMDRLQEYVADNGNRLSEFLSDWNGIISSMCSEGADRNNGPKIASPASSNSVRIMTIHKSKGLDFPHVILPRFDFAFYPMPQMSPELWVSPEKDGRVVDGTGLQEALSHNVFNVKWSSMPGTVFRNAYDEESLLQFVDTANMMYVAMTRAAKGNHIICASDKLPDPAASPEKARTAGDALWLFLNQNTSVTGAPADLSDSSVFGVQKSESETDGGREIRFSYGEYCDMAAPSGGSGEDSAKERAVAEILGEGVSCILPCSYNSWPLNASGARLKISGDAVEFFRSDCNSRRARGIVLHEVMSSVNHLSDVEGAVDRAVTAGLMAAEDAGEVCRLLRTRVESAAARGWFPDDDSSVVRERDIIVPAARGDKSVRRPDRVIISGDSVTIVDYKFGHPDPAYAEQVSRYASLYREMGYRDVSGYLWYLFDDRVEKVPAEQAVI